MKMRRKSGFTLVELLVVMCIIAILMGMMFVGLRMLTTGGIDASARKLQAALLKARSLAMQNNCMYSVVFNNASTSYTHFSEKTKYKEGAKIYNSSNSLIMTLEYVGTEAGDGDGGTSCYSGAGVGQNDPFGADPKDIQGYETYTAATTNPTVPESWGPAINMRWSGKKTLYSELTATTANPANRNFSTDDSWYAIVGHHPGKWNQNASASSSDRLFNTSTTTLTVDKDYSFEGSQVGPRHKLEIGSSFMALSYEDGSGGNDNPDSGKLWNSGDWSGAAIACLGNYRVTFKPDGEAIFVMAGTGERVSDANYYKSKGATATQAGVWQVIGIGVEDGGDEKSPYIGVWVNKYTGEVLVKK